MDSSLSEIQIFFRSVSLEWDFTTVNLSELCISHISYMTLFLNTIFNSDGMLADFRLVTVIEILR